MRGCLIGLVMGLLIVSCTSTTETMADAAYDAQKLTYCDGITKARERLTPDKIAAMTVEQAEHMRAMNSRALVLCVESIRELTEQMNRLVDELP